MNRLLILIFLSIFAVFSVFAANPDEILWQAREALVQYDIKLAETRYKAYQTALKNQEIASFINDEIASLPRLQQALENVEDVIVLDSILISLANAIDDSTYYPLDRGIMLDRIIEKINLPSYSGSLLNACQLYFIDNPEQVSGAVYLNADGTTAIYSAPGPQGLYILYEANKLSDGNWEIFPITDIPAPAYSPFLLDDGMTLYYISDGNTTLGNKDVMMSVRDAITEPWREPRNIGMPYNSPADELLFAIDAQDSIGWLVTMRNNIINGETAVLYRFMTSDIRRNIDVSDSNLRGRARISCIADTWPENFNPSQILDRIKDIDYNDQEIVNGDLQFVLPDGKIISSISKINNQRARNEMEVYLELKAQLHELESDLASMYAEYGASSYKEQLKKSISETEIKLDYLRADVQKQLNKILRILGYN